MKKILSTDFGYITKKTWTQDQFFKIFCGIMLGGICLFLLSLLFLGFDRWKYLFHILANPTDSFMDAFSPIYFGVNIGTLYQNVVNVCLPFTSLFTGVLGIFLTPLLPQMVFAIAPGTFTCKDVENCLPLIVQGHPLTSVAGSIFIVCFLVISLFLFFRTVWLAKDGNQKTKLIFCFMICFSMPFIWWFERGNYIIFAIISALIFVMNYDNPRKHIRHFALIALAISINIKIYPAALGLLLLKEKHYKDIIYLGIYTALLFLFSLMFCGGYEGLLLFIRNIKENVNTVSSRGQGYSYSLSSTLKMLGYALCGRVLAIPNQVFSILSICVLSIGAFAAYFIKSKWKTLSILCLLMILVPQISYTYVLLFMIIPLIYFLNDKADKNFKDMIYLILFGLIFMLNIPILAPIFQPMNAVYPVLLDNFCARMACLVMFIMLCYEGVKSIKYGK